MESRKRELIQLENRCEAIERIVMALLKRVPRSDLVAFCKDLQQITEGQDIQSTDINENIDRILN